MSGKLAVGTWEVLCLTPTQAKNLPFPQFDSIQLKLAVKKVIEEVFCAARPVERVGAQPNAHVLR